MTGYMAEMRKLVGHKTVMQCAASVVCVDGFGRLLLGQRTDNHLWGYAGGACEIDERAEDCARRELLEEMGLIADELTFFASTPDRRRITSIRTATRSPTSRSCISAGTGAEHRPRATARWRRCGFSQGTRSTFR